MRINEFPNRERPRPSVAKLVSLIITILVVILGALSIFSLIVGMGNWIIWSLTAWGGTLIGSICYLITQRRGRTQPLKAVITAAWGWALISVGLYLMEAESWHVLMSLGLVIPSVALLIYLMFVGIDVDALLYGDGRHPAQFRALGDPQDRIDPLQNPAERDVPVQRR